HAPAARRIFRSISARRGGGPAQSSRPRTASSGRRRDRRAGERARARVLRRRHRASSHAERRSLGRDPVTAIIRPALLAVAFAAAQIAPQCGSSSTTTPSTGTPTSTLNMQSVLVNSGPNNDYANGLFTSVTVCVPGTSSCQLISGILVDTGSTGLRVLSSALNNLNLPQQTATSGGPVVECAQFQDGFTWGPV